MTQASGKMRIRFFLSAVLITVGLLGMSMLLRSEEKPEVIVAETRPGIYELPVEVVTGKGTPNKDLIDKHLKAARKYGVGSLKDTSAINIKLASGDLINVQKDKGYVVGDMTHSYPVLTPGTLYVLRTIGASFYEATGNGSYFTITSLTRTEETQNQLRKRNSNAAKDESSHCYGVSFDISFIRFNGVREWNDVLTRKLEAILATMQERGDIYVVRERKQSCFHITARTKDLPEEADLIGF